MTYLRRSTAFVWRGLKRHPILFAAVLLLTALALPASIQAAGISARTHSSPHVSNAGSSNIHPDRRLMLTSRQWAEDQQGTTMDQMFPPNGFGMGHPVLVWWIVLELLGLIAFPFTFLFLSNLIDRGFVVAKTIGLLLVGYVVWISASIGLAPFERGVIWLAVGILAVLAAMLAFALRTDLVRFFQERWRQVLAGELVFLAGFAIFLALRMWYPDLGHQFYPVSHTNLGAGRMGEKQMELAFLNAIVRSRAFPPFDPFFSHGYINYYYYGFVLVGTLCKLTQIFPATGFNLAIATFFAMLVGNSYSVVLSLTRRVVPGIVAGVLVGLIGNLNGGWQLIRGLMSVATIHSTFPVFGGIVDVLSGLQQVVLGHQMLPPIDFWESTRIIPPPGAPISEFPYFTYLFADLHPHLMAFPMTVAALALAVNLALGSPGNRYALALSLVLGGLLVGSIAVTNPWDFPTYLLVVGIGAVAGSYVARRQLRPGVLLRPALWMGAPALLALLLFLPFVRGYHTTFDTGIGLVRDISPDSLTSLCDNNPMPCSQVVREALVTPLHIYLEHFGLFVFVLLSYLLLLLSVDAGGRARWRRWAMRAHFAWYYREHWRRLRRASQAARRLTGHQQPMVDPSIVLGLSIVVGGLLVFQYFLLAFLAAILGLVGLLLQRLSGRLSVEQIFLLLLITVPVGLSLLTQVVYFRDFLGGSTFRMNTIFKFYNQAWVLYAIASSVALYHFVVRLTPEQAIAGETAKEESRAVAVIEPVLVSVGGDQPDEVLPASAAPRLEAPVESRTPGLTSGFGGWWRLPAFVNRHGWWSLAFALLLAGSLVYTYGGTISRETYRTAWLPESSVPFTLDGMAFMKVAYPADYAAIGWLNSHVRGAPVIAEAYTPNGYTWPSRVAMFTGLPEIFNGIHENVEQRYGDEVDPTSLCAVASDPTACLEHTHSRPDDVKLLYDSSSTAEARRIIRLYGVKYIYVGVSERLLYSKQGLAKFDGMVGHGLSVAFRVQDTTIYRVTARA